jgi:hypothetical protein
MIAANALTPVLAGRLLTLRLGRDGTALRPAASCASVGCGRMST